MTKPSPDQAIGKNCEAVSAALGKIEKKTW